ATGAGAARGPGLRSVDHGTHWRAGIIVADRGGGYRRGLAAAPDAERPGGIPPAARTGTRLQGRAQPGDCQGSPAALQERRRDNMILTAVDWFVVESVILAALLTMLAIAVAPLLRNRGKQ